MQPSKASKPGSFIKMPFGKYAGLPFEKVPPEYLAWVVRRSASEKTNFAGLKAIKAELKSRGQESLIKGNDEPPTH